MEQGTVLRHPGRIVQTPDPSPRAQSSSNGPARVRQHEYIAAFDEQSRGYATEEVLVFSLFMKCRQQTDADRSTLLGSFSADVQVHSPLRPLKPTEPTLLVRNAQANKALGAGHH